MRIARSFIAKLSLCALPVSLACSASAQDAESIGATPKGYDKSFQTGDIPKPKEPELDPDLANEEELNPDKKPDENPWNSLSRDYVPDDFKIGVTAGLTFPHLINLGLDTVIFQKFGVALNYGNVTKSINSVDVAMKHTDVRFRWFPWGGSFFAGMAFGQHQMTGELDRDIKLSNSTTTVATHGKLVASANYMIPHFGWFAVWDSGFTLGSDFGYLMPSGAKATFTSSFKNAPAGSDDTLKASNEYKNMKSDLEDSAKKYASTPVPYATLLRIGWLF